MGTAPENGLLKAPIALDAPSQAYRRLHLVGIGGAGMSALAELLLRRGFTISGSDLVSSEVTRRLAQMGARVAIGHAAEHTLGVDLVIYSAAVPPTNVELEAARAARVPTIRRAEALGVLGCGKETIAVGGTHGKTTTASLTCAVLTEAGLDPTALVGGRIRVLNSGTRLGEGPHLVVEADEFGRSFLTLRPVVTVVTSVEGDHLDCYHDLADLEEAFVRFAGSTSPSGRTIFCADDPGARRLVSRVDVPSLLYGFGPDAHVRADAMEQVGWSTAFTLRVDGRTAGRATLRAPGCHNVSNALGAAAVGVALGVELSAILRGLDAWQGVHRRFEIKGTVGNTVVVDDYAHHPTEIRATLAAARALRSGPIVAVFQPHLYSRTRDFADDFGAALAEADAVVVMDVYPAREEPLPGVSGALVADACLRAGCADVTYVPDRQRLMEVVRHRAAEAAMVLTLGAGDIDALGEVLVDELRLAHTVGPVRPSAKGE
jgi:UDP-N-acetylmuramate--alanine ligase